MSEQGRLAAPARALSPKGQLLTSTLARALAHTRGRGGDCPQESSRGRVQLAGAEAPTTAQQPVGGAILLPYQGN